MSAAHVTYGRWHMHMRMDGGSVQFADTSSHHETGVYKRDYGIYKNVIVNRTAKWIAYQIAYQIKRRKPLSYPARCRTGRG